MIIVLAINGTRVRVSGDNLSVEVMAHGEYSAEEFAATDVQEVRIDEYPTEASIRAALLDAVKASGLSFSAICRETGIDTHFLKRVQRGADFRVKTYQRVMDFLKGATA